MSLEGDPQAGFLWWTFSESDVPCEAKVLGLRPLVCSRVAVSVGHLPAGHGRGLVHWATRDV